MPLQTEDFSGNPLFSEPITVTLGQARDRTVGMQGWVISRLVSMCSRTNGLSVWHTWIKASQECTRLFLRSLQAPEVRWDPSLYIICPRQRVHQAVSEGGCSLLWCTGDLEPLWHPGLSAWCIQPMLMCA